MFQPPQSRPAGLLPQSSHPSGLLPQSVACVNGSIQNGSICVDLPVVGRKCIPVGTHVADGVSASVCLERVFPPKVCAHVLGNQFCL
jgi:hypothetical protein